jgi:hypothetical protein
MGVKIIAVTITALLAGVMLMDMLRMFNTRKAIVREVELLKTVLMTLTPQLMRHMGEAADLHPGGALLNMVATLPGMETGRCRNEMISIIRADTQAVVAWVHVDCPEVIRYLVDSPVRLREFLDVPDPD